MRRLSQHDMCVAPPLSIFKTNDPIFMISVMNATGGHENLAHFIFPTIISKCMAKAQIVPLNTGACNDVGTW
jgi:hypothetical protein